MFVRARLAERRKIEIQEFQQENQVYIRQLVRSADRLSMELENQNGTAFPLSIGLQIWTAFVCAPNEGSYQKKIAESSFPSKIIVLAIESVLKYGRLIIEGLLGGSSQFFSSRTLHWGRIQMQSKFEGLQTRGRWFHFDSLTPSTVCQQTCLAGEYILDFIEIPIFRFSYVLSAVLAQTSSIPLKTIRIVHETY